MEQEAEPILFYNVHTQPFSNFYSSPFTVDGKLYPTAEHYYQSKKFQGTPKEEEIRTANSIKEAHELGHLGYIDSDLWNEKREEVYFEAMFNKFSQNEELREKLFETESKLLICIDSDQFWGKKFEEDTNQLEGKNTTGIILMNVRKLLLEQDKMN